MAEDNVKVMLHGCWEDMFRVKTPRYLPSEETTFNSITRQHTLLDLCNTGIYGVMAIGIFSLSGIVVKDFAGPSALISVPVAALAVVFTGENIILSNLCVC